MGFAGRTHLDLSPARQAGPAATARCHTAEEAPGPGMLSQPDPRDGAAALPAGRKGRPGPREITVPGTGARLRPVVWIMQGSQGPLASSHWSAVVSCPSGQGHRAGHREDRPCRQYPAARAPGEDRPAGPGREQRTGARPGAHRADGERGAHGADREERADGADRERRTDRSDGQERVARPDGQARTGRSAARGHTAIVGRHLARRPPSPGPGPLGPRPRPPAEPVCQTPVAR